MKTNCTKSFATRQQARDFAKTVENGQCHDGRIQGKGWYVTYVTEIQVKPSFERVGMLVSKTGKSVIVDKRKSKASSINYNEMNSQRWINQFRHAKQPIDVTAFIPFTPSDIGAIHKSNREGVAA